MIAKRLLLFAVLSLIFSATRAQDIQTLLGKINAYHDARPIEKIYLQLDKQHYTAGETIWFKAYSVIGVENLLSNLSQTAYVDLIDPKDRVLNKLRIPVVSGIGLGDITLTDTLIEGTYHLRAYSNWMRNDSASYFYSQNIEISNGRVDNVLTRSGMEGENYRVQLQDLQENPIADVNVRYEISKEGKSLKKGRVKTAVDGKLDIPFRAEYGDAKLIIAFENKEQAPIEKIFKLPKAAAENSIQLFAEGGSLLAGTLNKIAAKALRPNGLGIAAKTYIITAQGDTAAIIVTNSLGMGASPIFIEAGTAFRAVTQFEDSSVKESALPEIATSGYGIQVNNGNAAKLFAQLNISADQQDGGELYFVIQYLGRPYYVSKQLANKSELIFSVAKDELPNGVLTISILNGKLQPIMERPVFISKTTSYLPLKTALSTPATGTRQQVTVSLETGDSNDSVRHALLSAAVINTAKVNEATAGAGNILSNLLLSADIKGFIETPGYYFQEDVKTNEIDNLLLTQGWRKMDWITADTASSEPSFLPEKGISIRGQARKLGRKAPASGAAITLVSTKSFMDFIDTVANENGDFVFEDLVFPDSIKFLITAKNEKGKNNIDIIVPPYVPPTIGFNKNAAAEKNDINSLLREELVASKQYFSGLESQGLMEKTIAIQEVVVTARSPAKKASENSANLNGPGNADQIISAEDLETCPTLEMCLNGRLLGVIFRGGRPYSTRGGGEMQVVLDGMYIEGDQLSMISPMDIQSVEVLRNINYTAIYGSFGTNGLLIISTKTGKDALRNYVPKGIVTIQPMGYHLNKTFYKPTYEVDSETKLNQDFRSTIHWEPNIVTDEQGKATFDFYTSDEKGTYLITIEGVDLTGRIVRKTIDLKVE